MREALVHSLPIDHDLARVNVLWASVGDLGLVGVLQEGDSVDIQHKLIGLHNVVQGELPGQFVVVLHLHGEQA